MKDYSTIAIRDHLYQIVLRRAKQGRTSPRAIIEKLIINHLIVKDEDNLLD